MHVSHRPFNPERNDFDKMWRFLEQDASEKKDRHIWLVSRLGDWRHGLWNEKKRSPSFFSENAELWLTGSDELVGFVLSEDGDELFFILTRQGQDDLYPEILNWTVEHWGPRYESLTTEVHEFQAQALCTLERAGWRSLGLVATTRDYDLQNRTGITLLAGFKIVDMAENGDYVAKALLNVNGFDGREGVTEAELAMFAESRNNPVYNPQLDLSVVTQDGLHVASCVGFVDPVSGLAEVEKVCTHNQYRRQSLAEAAIRECFERLRKREIEWAFITGYSSGANALYEKLGPSGHKRWFHYELSSGGNPLSKL